ncbi:hypothetical protein bcgnr5379_62770 [Bacillus cereus]|uniref:hypothetical protein n=1 Tax=Lysobacter enzymogenes TaxID=69 RepID=UPI001556CED2|nr:hypothetical protein [Lysobacter enzymogenes]
MRNAIAIANGRRRGAAVRFFIAASLRIQPRTCTDDAVRFRFRKIAALPHPKL